MALGETAKLVAELDLKDNLTPGAGSAIGTVRRLEGATNTAQGSVGRLGGATGRTVGPMNLLKGASQGAGGALTHLKGAVGGLLGAAGIVGLGGAALSLVGILHGAIERTTELADTSRTLAGITHESMEAMSGLSAGLSHFGIEGATQTKIVGMLEKNLGLLAAGGGAKAVKFQKDFGFSILDASGNVKSAEQIISDYTDVFNNDAIPASQKAALAQKLFGRSWQDLLPVLSAGKGGLKAATDEAASFGETLTSQDVDALNKMKDATRTWHTALSGLETQIGLVVVPVITDLANAATGFLKDPNNRASIVGFFKDSVKFARDFVGFVKTDVLPEIKNLAGGAKELWDGIPAPLKDLLIKGFVADRTVKFLFGFSLADVGKDALSQIGKAVFGQLFQRGSSPANPLYVIAEGGVGGGGGAGGGIVGGGSSRLVQAVSIVAIAADVIAVLAAFNDFQNTRDQAQTDLQQKADATTLQTAPEALANLKNLNDTLGKQGLWESLITNTFGAAQTSEGLTNLANSVTNNGKLTASQITEAITTLQAAQAIAVQRGWTDAAAAIGTDIAKLQSGQQGAGAPKPGAPADVSLTTPTINQLGFVVGQHVPTPPDTLSLTTPTINALGFRVGDQVSPELSKLAGKFDTNNDHIVQMREAVAAKLGISVAELRALKRESGGWNSKLATKLGISNEKLGEVRSEAAKIVGKDWSPTIENKVSVSTALQVSGRTIANAVEKFWTISRPRAV